MAFEKGQVSNPVGDSRANRLFLKQLMMASVQEDHARMRKAAESLLTQAASGEGWAIKELADRVDGKPHQTIGGENGEGIPIRGTLEFVRAGEVAKP